MRRQKTIAVVVPAYREERLLPLTLGGMPTWVDHIIIVDDGSDDDTYAVARAWARRDSRFVAIQLVPNRGVGRAICVGYEEASRLGADVIAVMAGDNQMDPAELDRVVDGVIDGADYVKGRRTQHAEVDRMPVARRLGTDLLAGLTRLAGGRSLSGLRDAQCGYTAIRAEIIKRLDLDAVYPRYGYPNDILLRLAAIGARVDEVEVRPVYADEVSGFRPRDVVGPIGGILMRGWIRRLRNSIPAA